MRHTLTLPDGRTLTHASAKRWHVVVERSPGDGSLVRVSSSAERSRGLAHWRDWARGGLRVWLIDGETGAVERGPT